MNDPSPIRLLRLILEGSFRGDSGFFRKGRIDLLGDLKKDQVTIFISRRKVMKFWPIFIQLSKADAHRLAQALTRLLTLMEDP